MAEPLTKDKIVITIPVFETYVTLENLKSALDEFENLLACRYLDRDARFVVRQELKKAFPAIYKGDSKNGSD